MHTCLLLTTTRYLSDSSEGTFPGFFLSHSSALREKKVVCNILLILSDDHFAALADLFLEDRLFFVEDLTNLTAR